MPSRPPPIATRTDITDALALEEFREDHADELVPMWRESFEKGVGIVDWHPLEEQREALMQKVVPHNTVKVARLDGRMVGFVAATPSSIAQLYVRVGFHRCGIGTRMLDWAKSQSDGALWLYAFARNAGACAFYERHGFRAAARGFEPHWKLDDIRYEWVRR